MCQKWVGIRPVLIVFVRFWFSLGTLWYVYVIAIHQNSWRDLLQLLSSYSSKYVIVVNWYSTQNVSSSSLKLTIRRLAVMGYWWLWTKTSASKSTHYNDVIMSSLPSQITSLAIVYSAVYSRTDQRKHQSSASLALCVGNSPVTGEFPTQRASNAENISICWRHHVLTLLN